MTLLADAAAPAHPGLLAFLREELAPRPGRLAHVLQIAGTCALVLYIAMLYQIPVAYYMVYIVFKLSRDDTASTLVAGVAGVLGVTVAVVLSLLRYVVDASEPALRLPLMAGSAFLGMLLVHTMTLGSLAFLPSFVLVLTQTTIDKNMTMEALTRSLLWLWVAVAVSDAVTLLVNLVIGTSPGRLAHRITLRLLAVLAAALRSGDTSPLQREQTEAVELVGLRRRAGMFDQDLRGRAAIDTMLIETVVELFTQHRLLPAGTPIEARLPLAQACDSIALAFEHRDPSMMREAPRPADAVLANLSSQARPVIVALADAVTRLKDGVAKRLVASDTPVVPPVRSMFVADAFSNPDHARFALKTTIAVMAAYIIYSGLDWPGISTSVTTCFFVAQGSVGESIHKLTLRISGAVLGGIIAGLCIVYILPEMVDIGQFCLLIAAVSVVLGCIATSSDLLSYAGMQMALAFFLGVLQDYGPTTDLTEPRDRVVGILLGNLLIATVFSTLWPTSVVDMARSSLAKAFRALGQLLIDPAGAKVGARLAVIRAVGEVRRFETMAAFEQHLLPGRRVPASGEGLCFDSLARLAAATFVIVDQAPEAEIAKVVGPQDAAAAAWFIGRADRLATGEMALAEADASASVYPAAMDLPDNATISSRAAIEARALLRAEVENAVADPA